MALLTGRIVLKMMSALLHEKMRLFIFAMLVVNATLYTSDLSYFLCTCLIQLLQLYQCFWWSCCVWLCTVKSLMKHLKKKRASQLSAFLHTKYSYYTWSCPPCPGERLFFQTPLLILQNRPIWPKWQGSSPNTTTSKIHNIKWSNHTLILVEIGGKGGKPSMSTWRNDPTLMTTSPNFTHISDQLKAFFKSMTQPPLALSYCGTVIKPTFVV